MVNIKISALFFLLFFLLLFSFIYLDSRVKGIQDKVYLSAGKDLQKRLTLLLDEKSRALLKIALTLSQYKELRNALIKNDSKAINFNKTSMQLRAESSYKNVWFHIVDKKGRSFYRSWTDKQGDSLISARLDVAKMMKHPKIMSSISVGKYDLGFKSMVPIFHKGHYIGLIEVIAKFNSVASMLQKEGMHTLFLVDKSYKKQITEPFSDFFINDYYVANVNAKLSFVNYLKSIGLEEFIQGSQDHYADLEKSQLVVRHTLKDLNGSNMAYLIVARSLKNINFREVNEMQNYFLLFVVGTIASFFATIVFVILRRQKTSLAYAAHYDSLTTLPNRMSFLKRLEKTLIKKKKEGDSFVLLFIDLDNFKEINDDYGHEAGDTVLVKSGERIRSLLRDKDCIARLGGDEFTVIIDDIHQVEDIIPILERLITMFEAPIECCDTSLEVKLSIGVAVFPMDGTSSKELIKSADMAMYDAKKSKHSSYSFTR